MVTAWDFPQNPLTDKTLDQSKLSKEIQLGYRLFTNTPAEAERFVPGGVSCNNCHLNGGPARTGHAARRHLRRLSGVQPPRGPADQPERPDRRLFPSQRERDRKAGTERRWHRASLAPDALPNPTSREVLALAAYLTWLSRGNEIGKNPSWRGQNTIPQASLVPVDKLDPAKGEAIYKERCVSCHGPDGQGVFVGDKRPGPLWGPDSWNDGAGAARVYTLAGIIRYTMPYLDPGNMTDEDAQQLAAFITSKPRPSYPVQGPGLPGGSAAAGRGVLPEAERRRSETAEPMQKSEVIKAGECGNTL